MELKNANPLPRAGHHLGGGYVGKSRHSPKNREDSENSGIAI